MIYLDHAATTPPEPAVIDAVSECMRTLTANPSAAYSAAAPCRAKIIAVKKQIAAYLGVTPQEIFFTSGGTESNSHAIFQAAGKYIVIGAAEHRSIFAAAANFGCEVTLARPDKNGVITPEAVLKALRPDTALVSVQYVNNETGVINPIREIADAVKSRKIPFHTDAVAAFGHIPIDMTNITMLSVSAHKFYGPRGIGFLYIKQGCPVKPLIAGEQESSRRGGTENLPGICGLGAAIGLLPADMNTELARLRRLREEFLTELRGTGISETVSAAEINGATISKTDSAAKISGATISKNISATEINEATISETDSAAEISGTGISKTDSAAKINGATISETVSATEITAVKNNTGIYPGIISLRLPGFPSEKAISLLDSKGISVSGGAACSRSSHSPSHVLISMGFTPTEAFEVIRISMGRGTTEMKTAATAIKEIYGK
jgi:cysteine desulfurase